MKAWSNFLKEIRLTSNSWYFYVEIVMAVIMLLIVMFVVPIINDIKNKEYVFIDLPDTYKQIFYDDTLKDDIDGKPENSTLTVGGKEIPVIIHEEKDKIYYYMPSLDSVKKIAEEKQCISAYVKLNKNGNLDYIYYHQGYESERLINLIKIIHNKKMDLISLENIYNQQTATHINKGAQKLSDNDYIIPLILTLNGSFMGMFIIAAYIFLDKDEGVIKAFAVTASKIWHYTLGKIGIEALTGIITGLIIVIPTLGLGVNYPLLILFILSNVFFASSIGILITTYFKDFMQSIGIIVVLIFILMIPSIAYMMPSWTPSWIKVIPSYYMLECFKELILPTTDIGFVLMCTAGFFAIGLMIFVFANRRFKRVIASN